MSILLDKNTKLLVHGLTGAQGSFHAGQCMEYGSKVVGGVTPGKGGTEHLGVPVFNTAKDAVRDTGANASLIFVPPPYAADSILEAADAGVSVVICITEGIPVMDMVRVKKRLAAVNACGRRVTLVGPNCPGVITPGECKAGIMPGYIHKPGSVGVVSRSGTLTYEAVWQVTCQGLGQSSVVGIGGDPVQGMNFVDALRLFQGDPRTEAVIMIGEIGGSAEEDAARYIKAEMTKPVFCFVAGKTAPPGRRMGHAGAIVEGGAGTHASKVEALAAAGATVVDNLSEIGAAVAGALAPKAKAKSARK
ncbi:MAG TPA: succinate--CoA ligase subunit alpha [Elusimicrobia bacterium]|nr:MAG: succinate--CoA ligase subunit alpha [Elusimicrobia bacterium GWA2_64_40]OGR66130.1 MAG: succinate--CoA ligase subunit alpha [Elusimicrobia bacterium GWB2_63_16]HAN03675.1 succinate--CoA ligase subunit alpha [Elusimicrobiota bacterium]HAU89104.1 succinate--CoA ligase subunit alpha [Elusimicrobiota bacterium]